MGSAEIVASDVSVKRLAQTEARLRRYSYAERVGFEVADAVDAKGVEGSFDLILCDAPCSGTGTLAGNPEIRHRLKVEEFARQAERRALAHDPFARIRRRQDFRPQAGLPPLRDHFHASISVYTQNT